MVREIEGHGKHFGKILQNEGVDVDLRKIIVPYGESAEERLKNLLEDLEKYPDSFEASYLLRNVVSRGDPINILFVPRNCPPIYDREPVEGAEDKPKEGEAWYAEVTYIESRSWEFLILAKSEKEAEKVAANLSSEGERKEIFVKALTSDEFMNTAENMLRKGYKLSPRVLRFGKLPLIARETEQEKNRQLQEEEDVNS